LSLLNLNTSRDDVEIPTQSKINNPPQKLRLLLSKQDDEGEVEEVVVDVTHGEEEAAHVTHGEEEAAHEEQQVEDVTHGEEEAAHEEQEAMAADPSGVKAQENLNDHMARLLLV